MRQTQAPRIVPINTRYSTQQTPRKRWTYWLSEDRFREGYSVHPAVTSPLPSWTALTLQWPRFAPRALRAVARCLVVTIN